MALFDRLSIEDLEQPLEATEGDVLDSIIDPVDSEIVQQQSEINTSISEIETANNVVDAIDGMLAKDREVIEAGTVTDDYAQMSVENFRNVLSIVGVDLTILKVSQESFGKMTALELLHLSIEEKEEVKKSLLAKIGGKIKELGERFGNTLSLIKTAYRNDLNVIKDIRSKIKAASPKATSEMTAPSKTTANRLVFGFAYLNLKKLDDAGYVKLCNETFDYMLQTDNIKNVKDNLHKLITGNYIDVKFTAPSAKTEFEKHLLESLKEEFAKHKIEDDKLIGYFASQYWDVKYFSGEYTAQPTAIALYSKNQKPTFFKGATGYFEFNAKFSFAGIEEIDDVELPSLATLSKVLDRVEKAINDLNKIVGDVRGIYTAVDAIGDISPLVYINLLVQHIESARIYYTKGYLHLVNTMLKHYKA